MKENQDILIKMGNVIREERLITGLSQEKFALKIGMDRTYFSDVENGKRNISILNLEKIIAGLDINISDFFRKIEGGSHE